MIDHPATKYRPFPAIDLPQRQWPARHIGQLAQAPVWLSTDLRDGNQALFEPMNVERKLMFFARLVACGFREIEVGFPAASQTDFDTVRRLIEEDRVPEGVTLMVMTQLREDLIERTVAALRGARRAIVHLYNATAPLWRERVFGLSVPEVMGLVDHHVRHLRRLTDAVPDTEWVLQYSPETFCMTELPVSLQACRTALDAWDAGPGRPVIINLPTTVEVATPNVFADQIEWMDRHLPRRAHVVLSVHPHNDRGTGVACAELALLAGAQRVEGCLFGNGERSGNVDLVTLALNLYTQGVHPGLDLSDLPALVQVAEQCTALPVHPRHPYAGDLVFTAFSGSHQDAIKKGLAAQRPGAPWAVPYLPIDPADIGRSYEGIIRVNSQSGKGGIAYLLERDHGLVMPRRMQVEFSAVVQRHADASEAEVTSAALWQLFSRHYLSPQGAEGAVTLSSWQVQPGPQGGVRVRLQLAMGEQRWASEGEGADLLQAAAQALAPGLRLGAVSRASTGQGRATQHWVLVEGAVAGAAGTAFGAGHDADAERATLQAVLSLACRLGCLTQPAEAVDA
ncbi:2-isopropylmalate synthase [Ideonella dechloratans]|uniref:2-isopropylmalate synthase n=1 Tax=Ideonella dechloratans TaxID=36863 RepID=UPI0035B0C3AE